MTDDDGGTRVGDCRSMKCSCWFTCSVSQQTEIMILQPVAPEPWGMDGHVPTARPVFTAHAMLALQALY